MSKHIDLSGLKTLLEPLVHLINKKAERPDWNENDSSSPDYIENRPFYTESKTDFLVEQQEIVIDDGLYANLTANATFVVGETYTVVIDGVEYQCVAWQGSDGVCIGNGDIYGGEGLGGDEPFSCDSYDDGSMYLNTLELGTYTISIAGLSEKVHKIDDKYLPEMVGIKGSVVGAEIFNADVNIANGNYSHAEGIITVASGYASHAEGEDVQASGRATHAEGVGTIASGDYQHIQGKYNTEDIACAHIVGNGNSWDDRSNAHTLDWDGNAWFAGTIKVGGTGQYDSAAQEVALKSDLASAGISVDETLTISGAAADSKTVGDKISNLSTLVGDTSVSDQISSAMENVDDLPENGQPGDVVVIGPNGESMWASRDVVTYEMFGATLDGVADDTEAVIACHEFANEHGFKVEQHRGTLYLKTATVDHCPIIKTSCDWSGMTILMTEEMEKNVIMKVIPDTGLQERMLTAEEIAQLTDDNIKIGFLENYPNHICHFTTNIYIGNRSGFPSQNYVYHETVTVDRHGHLIDGRLFRHMTDATSVKMEYQSIFENPIEIKGAKIVLNTTDDSKVPTIYVSRSNTTVSNFTLEIKSQTSTNSVEYKGEVFRITNCYNTVVEKISGENFGTFFDDGVENKSETCYILFLSGLSRCTVRDCVLLRAWGPIQTQYCKDMIFKDSTFGRVDNHYHCRNYTVTNCTFTTSHSCINIGYGDGKFVIDNVRFIKFNDPDTTFMNYCINLRGEFCALYSGELIVKNVYVENNTDQYINMIRGSYGSYYNFSDDPSVILPLSFPRTYIENVTYTSDQVEMFRYEITEDSYPVVNGLTINVQPVELKNAYRVDVGENDAVRLRFTANYGTYSNVKFKGHEYGVIVTAPRLTSLRPQVVPVNMLIKDSYINGMSGSVKDNMVLYNCKVWGQDGFSGALRLFLQNCRIYMSSSDTIKFKPIMRLYMTDCVIERTGSVTPTQLDIPDLYHFKNNYYIGQLDKALAEKLKSGSTISDELDFYLDDSLSVSGAAADAKVTGDAIAGLNELVGDTKVSTQISNAIDGYKPHSLFVNDKPSVFAQPSNSQPFVTLYNDSGTRNYAISADASGVGMHAYDENGAWKSYTPMYSALNKPTASELGIKDEKVNVEVRDGTTSNASMSPVGITSAGTGTLNLGLVKYSGIQYNIVNGDASTLGKAQMVLGNNIASGTDGNKQGQISLFSANGMASGKIIQEDKTSTSIQYITHTLPNTSGTLLNTGNYKSYVTPANIGAATADSVSTLNTLVGDTKVSTQISNAVSGLALASVVGAGTTSERFELRSPNLSDLMLVTKRDGGIFVYDTTKATSVATAYTTANKPTYSDVGAAAYSHNHAALASGNSTLGIADYTGDVPLMTARYNSKQSFALQQDSAGSNNVLLHTYSSTGAWQKGGKILTSNHLSFSLNGTTLTITDTANP